jgi:hypothetical protein
MIEANYKKMTKDLPNRLRCGLAMQCTTDLINYFDSLDVIFKQLPLESIKKSDFLIANLLQQYENQDWLGIADTIEYDVKELLE